MQFFRSSLYLSWTYEDSLGLVRTQKDIDDAIRSSSIDDDRLHPSAVCLYREFLSDGYSSLKKNS